MTGSPASEFAVQLLAELIDRGVRDVVLSPGSRSQALALAAAEYEGAGRIRLHVRIDERSAGFLALGLSVESGRPVAVITTSGTAVAELHPAVLEAAHSGVPLVLLTADRPDELRGIGSNQTTTQPGIFGPLVRCIDVEAPVDGGDHALAAAGFVAGLRLDGPIHLNLQFREPLSGASQLPRVEERRGATRLETLGEGSRDASAAPALLDPRNASAAPALLDPRPGTVVIAGARAGEAAEEVARALGAPLLAEVVSGSRFGPNLVPAYRELLHDEEFGGLVDRAVVYGHPTLSREVPALLQRDDVEVVVVRAPGVEAYNPGRRARIVDAVDVDGEPDPSWARAWVGSWVHASRQLLETADPIGAGPDTEHFAERAAFARDALAELREPVTRRMLVDAVWRASWPHDRLVLGASRLIRELDRVAPGKRIPVHANRGLAGIDGTIATATGIALASQADEDARPGITRVLLGDLALLHDAGSLLAGHGEPTPRLQIIVGNDGGGTIFDGLEVARTADPALIDRVLYTPQRIDLAALAAAYGWEHRLVTTRGDLDPALTPTGARVLIEVPLSR